MAKHRGFVLRILADLFVAISVTLGMTAASHSASGAWLIAVGVALLLAVGAAGYLEPSASKVWIHPLVMMSPEVVALPAAFLTCRGHGCAGVIAFLIAANLFTLFLVVLSFVIFYVRRRIVRAGDK